MTWLASFIMGKSYYIKKTFNEISVVLNGYFKVILYILYIHKSTCVCCCKLLNSFTSTNMNLMKAQNSIYLILAFNMGASFVELFVALTDGDYHTFLTVNR